MSVGFYLVNWTKKERIYYLDIGAYTATELAGDPAAAAITTWYLLKHREDHVAFVTDCDDDWPFPDDSKDDLLSYPDVTAEVVDELVAKRVLIDEGRQIVLEDDPELTIRKLRMNGWAWVPSAWVPSEFELSLRQDLDDESK